MRLAKVVAVFTFIAVFAVAFAVAQQPAGKALLEQARAKKAAGDLQGAAELFEKVIADFAATDRNSTANALLELGAFSESLAQSSRASAYYNRVRNEFSDQRQETATAIERLAVMDSRKDAAARREKIVIKTPYTEDPYSFAISPDGRTIVYQSLSQDGKNQLWRQAVDTSAKPEPIAGTEGAGPGAYPFFSPDGRSIAYFANKKLWQVELAGGKPKEIADTPSPYGGAWSSSGMVFSGQGSGAPLSGFVDGRLTQVTRGAGLYQVFPTFLDDRRFLYFQRDARGSGTLAAGAVDGSTPSARGLPPAQAGTFGHGFLFFTTQAGNLSAVPFDVKQMAVTGAPVIVSERVGKEDRYPGQATFSVSGSGDVAFREAALTKRQVVWMDRTGALVGSVGAADAALPGAPRISPDGQSIVMSRQVGATLGSVWVMDAQGALRQMHDNAMSPLWSPGGDRLLYATYRGSTGGPLTSILMFEREVGPNNAGLQAPVAPPVRGGARGIAPAGRDVGPSNGRAFPEDWAQNGAILFRTGGRGSDDGGSLFVFQPSGGDPVPVAQTPATERNGRFSPDGAWITYQSDESGRNEIYVQPFPGTPGQRQRVTLGGGTSSQWGKKGTELYFLGPDNRLMVVNVTVAADRRTMELSTPKALFASPIPQGAEYDTRDGERFLVLMPVEASPPIVVLPKWTAGR